MMKLTRHAGARQGGARGAGVDDGGKYYRKSIFVPPHRTAAHRGAQKIKSTFLLFTIYYLTPIILPTRPHPSAAAAEIIVTGIPR